MVRCKRDEKGELLLPSAGEELLPPPAGGPPPSRREVFGEGCGGRASIVERGRRVIGATAKPLYAIGGKAGGLGRRVNPVGWREETLSTECGRGTPSTACGRSPSLEEGGLWGGVRGTSKYRREGAKGDRGDRKAPICNRRQGRRAWPTGEPSGVEGRNAFYRVRARNSFHRLRAVPLPRGGRSLGRGAGGRRNGQVSLRGAKDNRGDRKAPIYNRRQGRRA